MKKLLLLTISMVLFIGCQKDETNDSENFNTGKIAGTVLSKNGQQSIGGALVFSFDDDHELIYTRSDENGQFVLQLPTGNREIHIQTGDGSNFRTNFIVNIQKDITLTIDSEQSKLNQVANIAYVSGSYDIIEDLISNLGYNATQITFSDLANYNIISQYDIIFLNCGSRNISMSSLNNAIDVNLAQFVTNGGSLYASDWALAYLMGGGSNVSSCNMTGGFIPDNTLCSINNGVMGFFNAVQIVDTNLSNSVGFSSFDLEYDLSGWQQIQTYDNNYWTCLVELNSKALMLKTNSFFDSSLETNPVGNDNNDEWVTICHIPPGNQNNPITITINQSALSTHLAHGDTLGSCDANSNGGTIYYTTFHNHASGNIGNSEAILNYVILNL